MSYYFYGTLRLRHSLCNVENCSSWDHRGTRKGPPGERQLLECATKNSSKVSRCDRYHLSQREDEIPILTQNDNFFDMIMLRKPLEVAA